jgi:hypothetical protein
MEGSAIITRQGPTPLDWLPAYAQNSGPGLIPRHTAGPHGGTRRQLCAAVDHQRAHSRHAPPHTSRHSTPRTRHAPRATRHAPRWLGPTRARDERAMGPWARLAPDVLWSRKGIPRFRSTEDLNLRLMLSARPRCSYLALSCAQTRACATRTCFLARCNKVQ